MSAQAEEFQGIYDVSRAALVLRTAMRDALHESEQEDEAAADLQQIRQDIYLPTPRHLIRWIHSGLASLELVATHGRELLITFEDLISLRIIAALAAAGVSWAKIHQAEDLLRQLTGKDRPFATEAIWTETSEVFVQFKNALLNANRGQLAFEFMRQYMIPISGLSYEQDMAATWEPRPGILLHPQVQFGDSCVKDTSIPTKALWGLVKAGTSVTHVARSYGIEPDDVWKAVRWEDSLLSSN